MSREIVRGKDHPGLIHECIRLASSNPQKNLLLLADLYPPHIDLSEVYVMLHHGKTTDFSTIYRGFTNPSIVLGINESTKKQLLQHMLSELKGDFMCVCEPNELDLFKGVAKIADVHFEYQMILRELIKPQSELEDGKVESIGRSELGKLDQFLRENGALAWRPIQFESGPYCCVRLDGEIMSVAGVHFVTPRIAQLGNIVTAEPYRNQGYATLCTYTLASMLESNNRVVSLFVAEDNRQAIRVYEKIGFHKKRKVAFANLFKS